MKSYMIETFIVKTNYLNTKYPWLKEMPELKLYYFKDLIMNLWKLLLPYYQN